MRPTPADFDATEADTCRRLITPKLIAAGWDEDPHSIAEQRTFTAGRIVLVGNRPQRLKQRRADYLLRYTRDFTLAVVEAKPEQLRAGEGIQQAKEYAEMLGLKFAYAAVALRARTQAVARHLSDFLKKTDRFAKTIVFCVDQEHADEMRRALSNLNSDLVRDHPNFAVRVTAADGDIGRGHLSRFQELETVTPVVVTTSQLLTTGVDIQTCRNVALVRVINSMTEFKQIIGRGTRVREDYGKLFFNILDYTGSATRLFADSEFDGEPARIVEEQVDENGQVVPGSQVVTEAEPPAGIEETTAGATVLTTSRAVRPKYYFDGGQVEIAAHLVYELDAEGRQLRVVQLTDYTAERMRTLYRSTEELRADWTNPERRTELVRRLEERGIDCQALADAAKQPEADPFDLLCHVAFNAPLRTRRERADRLRRDAKDLLDQYGPQARAVLGELLDKYCDHGVAQLIIPDALKVPPISERGNVAEIAEFFGGTDRLREAVLKLQARLYAV